MSFSPTSDTTAARRGGRQSSLPGELWVPFVGGSQQGFAQWDTLSPLCLASALLTSKHLSARGSFCHPSKQPRPSHGLGALLKELAPLHCLAGLGAFPALHANVPRRRRRRRRLRPRLGTSCQCLPRGRESRLPELSIMCLGWLLAPGLVANQPVSSKGWGCYQSCALSPSPAATKSRILQGPSPTPPPVPFAGEEGALSSNKHFPPSALQHEQHH